MPRGLRFSTAVHRTFSNNFRTRKNPISQARKRPGSYPILPPPRAIPNPIPTTPKPDLPVKNGDPGLKTGYCFTLPKEAKAKPYVRADSIWSPIAWEADRRYRTPYAVVLPLSNYHHSIQFIHLHHQRQQHTGHRSKRPAHQPPTHTLRRRCSG